MHILSVCCFDFPVVRKISAECYVQFPASNCRCDATHVTAANGKFYRTESCQGSEYGPDPDL